MVAQNTSNSRVNKQIWAISPHLWTPNIEVWSVYCAIISSLTAVSMTLQYNKLCRSMTFNPYCYGLHIMVQIHGDQMTNSYMTRTDPHVWMKPEAFNNIITWVVAQQVTRTDAPLKQLLRDPACFTNSVVADSLLNITWFTSKKSLYGHIPCLYNTNSQKGYSQRNQQNVKLMGQIST